MRTLPTRPSFTLLTSLALLVPAAAYADETYTCTNQSLTRTISVVQTGSEPVPCEVRYQKGDAAPQTLWNANNEIGYCEERAKEFVALQRGWGWECASAAEADTSES